MSIFDGCTKQNQNLFQLYIAIQIMPRTQVYISKILIKVHSLLSMTKYDAADKTEANISSVVAIILDLGLRVH